SIKASVTSLQDEAVDFDRGERGELLQTILEETDRLNRMVGNLLDLSRMRAGALVPAREPVAVADVIGGVLSRLRPVLEGRPVEVRVPEDLPDLPLDVVQFDQVLTNLLENAVKFSPSGTAIEVTASRFRDGVQVRVVDHGEGIPEPEREQVFEPFYRRDADRAAPGSGLGLAIARAVVSVHEGRIWAEGTPAGGTTIVLELPATRDGEEPR
ncbi:MAG TPA: ATP-binding protein, partial [Actinomycetota bacterium]|nr:ATP-binding protein [Actinomycetota bacterium]